MEIITPIKFAHVVLRAKKYKEQIAFYQLLLGAQVVHSDKTATFLTYDDEHHRIAITNLPGLLPRLRAMAGVDHYAFTYEDLGGLLSTYTRMKANGHEPVWCTHHGATISIYYQDADTNVVETQVDVFGSIKETNDYINSRDFKTNPIGVDFNPDEMLQKLNAGASWEDLSKRVTDGPRHPATMPREYVGWFHWTMLQLMRKLGATPR